jgi:hypothetical protein
MATSGEKRWPPVGKFVAAVGENLMAIDNRMRGVPTSTDQSGRHAPYGLGKSGARWVASLAAAVIGSVHNITKL